MIKPAVSICIPAYRQPELLKRCLRSISGQHFSDYEVIVTDDSPDDSVELVMRSFGDALQYVKNLQPLGSPANWNAGLQRATGRYVKIMHQDDWFAVPEALGLFVEALETHTDCDFVFSACENVGSERWLHRPSAEQLRILRQDPASLFSGNFIGAPSTGMFRNNPDFRYDERMKWLVDVDQYIRVLQHNPRFVYLDRPLVNIGLHEGQVTGVVSGDKKVVIPEYLLLLEKLSPKVLQQVRYFDYCWRLLRNYKVRSVGELQELAGPAHVPRAWLSIVRWQSQFSTDILHIGPVSKSLMLMAYLFPL